MRDEKLAQKEVDLGAFIELRELKGQVPAHVWENRLIQSGFEGEQELEATIKKTERQLQKARNKELGIEEVQVGLSSANREHLS